MIEIIHKQTRESIEVNAQTSADLLSRSGTAARLPESQLKQHDGWGLQLRWVMGKGHSG